MMVYTGAGRTTERLRTLLTRAEIPESAIRARREAFGISQRRLAGLSGVSQMVIYRLESRDQLITDAAARKLGVALKMDRYIDKKVPRFELSPGGAYRMENA